MLFLANWRRKFPLYDPFCGSATILIEAAMYAWDMAPGLGRRFALENLPIANRGVEEEVRTELGQRINFERVIRIAGSDHDPRMVSIAVSNIKRAYDLALEKSSAAPGPSSGQLTLPKVQRLLMEEARAPGDAEPPGFIVTNPPDGKRLGGPEEAEAIYGGMEVLGKNFSGWKLALITSHPGFESFFGRKADSCREINNGAIPSYFFQYEAL
jgi:putative N6-adenine-specific DNA methylase